MANICKVGRRVRGGFTDFRRPREELEGLNLKLPPITPLPPGIPPEVQAAMDKMRASLESFYRRINKIVPREYPEREEDDPRAMSPGVNTETYYEPSTVEAEAFNSETPDAPYTGAELNSNKRAPMPPPPPPPDPPETPPEMPGG